MSKPTYNEQIIRQYLLSALPDAETEELDELSIADDEFVSALSVVEKELVDSYVKGELNPGELENFEGHYLTSSLRRNKVDFAGALQAFGERSATPADRASATTKARGFPGLSLFNISRLGWQWGFAVVTLIFLVVGGLLVFQNRRLREQVNQTQARHDELQQRELELEKRLQDQRTANDTTEAELARVREERARLEEQLSSRGSQPSLDKATIASLILTPQLRSTGPIQTVTISPTTERLAIQLQLEPNDYSTYSVALIDQSSGQVLWRSGRTRAAGAGDHKSLSVGFRSTLLHSGMYRMEVSGIPPSAAAEVLSNYPFRVVKQ